VFEFTTEVQLEQVRQGIVQLDEVFAGIMQIPVIGSVRIGHQRIPQGVEGDQISSSKVMTFMEKSSMTDAIFGAQNFAPGIWTGNSILDQHLTWQAMAYRQELDLHDSIGADFGDGKMGYTGRMTVLPVYVDDGRYLVHLGASATWRKAENPDATSATTVGPPAMTSGLVGPGVVRFRARPELRDASGDFGGDVLNNAGAIALLPGNFNRMVDTGNIAASAQSIFAGELIGIAGPWSVCAEWAYTQALDAIVAPPPQFVAPGTFAGPRNVGNIGFHGGYVTVSYFLTGENRLYDRRLGRWASNYIARPNTRFWLLEGKDGKWLLGRGAWEVAARYSYVNLNDGLVQGGVMGGVTLGLNWYLNENLKIQFNYVHNNRYDRLGGNPISGGVGTATPGNLSETVDGFGIRTQFFF
jgi:phosphate-selective porin OprO/OprP